MAIPDTNTFTLQNVANEISPILLSLQGCFNEADAGAFDPTYEGNKNSLLNFRNYGSVFVWEPIDIETTRTSTMSAFYDGTYVYAGVQTGVQSPSNLSAYSFTGGTDLTHIAEASAPVSTYWVLSVYVNGPYSSNNPIFLADEFYGLFVYTFDGSSFTYVDSDKPASNRDFGTVTGDGTHIYTRDSASIYAYSFDGSILTLIDSISNSGNQESKLYYVNGYLYSATLTGVSSYSFDGNTLSLVDTWSSGSTYYGIWSNGIYVYTTVPSTGTLIVLSTSNGILTYETEGVGNTITNSDRVLGVDGNDNYVFVLFEDSQTSNEALVAFTADATGVNEVAAWPNAADTGQPLGLYATNSYVFMAMNNIGLYAFDIPF